MTIAIVGGGIAGLALALNLHDRGVACQVFEAAPELRELGVGITLLPHAVRELTALGLGKVVADFAIENASSAFFNRFGQKIYGEARGVAAGYAYPEYGVHRGRLHMALYREVLSRLGAEAVVADRRCTKVDQVDQHVLLEFTSVDGTVHRSQADAVVACDGVNSAIRSQFYPEETIKYTGINTWRGVTRRPPILDGKTYLRIGSLRTGKMVIYPIADDVDGSGYQLINWVAEIETPTAAANDWNRTTSASSVPEVFDDWIFPWLDVPAMVRQADVIFEYPMVDKDPVDRWTFGRVTLAGDAAHPMYPRGSNGSAQALIDVRVLADSLAGAADAGVAFEEYEAQRREITSNIVRTNRINPPDIINIRVEELSGDKPFDDLDALISQDELRELSDQYKTIAGFSLKDVAF